MKRKLLSLCLVVAMLASVAVFTPSASAAESLATLEFSDAAGTPGETVTVDFTITTAALFGLQFMFEYDASRLTYDSISWTTAYGTTYPKDLSNSPIFVQFTKNGPYIVESMAFDAGAQDFSAGVLAATLTFTIKEDAPAGDAYVKFAPLAEGVYQPNKLVPEIGVEILKDEMTFVDGTVTVLPEGYAPSATVADEDWDFEDGILWGCLDESLVDYTGALVIPSEIGGVEVVEIAGAAFDGYSFSTLVIPETVEFIEAGAVYNCYNLTKVYVLGDETELNDLAIGYEGSWRSGRLRNPSIILDENYEVLTSIYGIAGSLAQEYAEAGDGYDVFPFYSEIPYTVSFNGTSYLVGSETYAPGVAIIGDKLAVAWTDGVNTYVAGAAMTLTENVLLEPITITPPETSAMAALRLGRSESDIALRFTAELSKTDYATLTSIGDVELGMLITPAKYVSLAGSFTKEALDTLGARNGAYIDLDIEGFYSETPDDYTFASTLKNFSSVTLAKNPDFSAVLYATVTTDDGTSFTVYGNFNFYANRNVKTVAEAMLDANITNTQKTWLRSLIAKFY